MTADANRPMPLEPLAEKLVDWMRRGPLPVVAFSGGVDSAVVAKAAQLAHPQDAVAVTGISPSVAEVERRTAREVARQIGIHHVELVTHELQNPSYTANEPDRCFHCKTELYGRLWELIGARFSGKNARLLSGANADDWGDHRPGLQAATNAGVLHPLTELQLSKAAVRELAKFWGLPVWNKPASPCLASRLAYGVAVTPERLQRVERAESLLRQLGWHDCRVRVLPGEIARIEVPLETMTKLLQPEIRKRVTSELRLFGFRAVTVDLEGLRSGSLNALVPQDQLGAWRQKPIESVPPGQP